MATALSLVCKECNQQLKNVKEAQDHNELTGHTQFEESTEATSEAPVLNTEVEMKDAKDALEEEAATLKAALGVPDRPPGAEEEQVEPEVNEKLLEELQSMGFSRHRAVRALHGTGSASVEAAVNWVVDHDGDEDLDTPLLVPKSKSRRLTPEEAKEKAAALMVAAKAKREAAEREAERIREKERIRAGKELAAAARLEEETRFKRLAEERAREKAEEARAREKIRLKLEEDRRERRRKLGLPEELTEEEKEAERKKAADKAAAEAARKLPAKPIGVAEKLRATLVGIKHAHPNEVARVTTCFQTLLKMVGNVARAPQEEKFRRIRLSNPVILEKVVSLDGSVAFLETIGFERDADGEHLSMPETKVNMEVLSIAGGELNNALTNPFFGKL